MNILDMEASNSRDVVANPAAWALNADMPTDLTEHTIASRDQVGIIFSKHCLATSRAGSMRHVSTGGLDVDREFFTLAIPQSAVARIKASSKGGTTSASDTSEAASATGAGAAS